jgi:hypothetical protein
MDQAAQRPGNQRRMAIQRMTVATWLSLRAKERESGLAESTGQVTLRDWRGRQPADL